jgi:DNA-binding GntR family transcriptional regulator
MVTQIDRPPALGAVVEVIRKAILRGEICLGEALRELDLSDQLFLSNENRAILITSPEL